MSNTLFLPGNERELVDNYLDRTRFPELAEKYDCQKDDNSDTSEDTKCQAFQSAMRLFACRLCERQRQRCEEAYWNAPCGEEAECVRSAPMPDLCADTEAYEAMERWWSELTPEQKLDIIGAYEGLFNDPVYDMTKSDDELDTEADKRWSGLSIDDKNLIYERLKNQE